MNRAMKMALALCMALWLVVPVGGMAVPVTDGRPYPSSVTVTYGSTTSGNLFSGDLDMSVTVPFGVTTVTVTVKMSPSGYQAPDITFVEPAITIDISHVDDLFDHSAPVTLSGNSTDITIMLGGRIALGIVLLTPYILTINSASQPSPVPPPAPPPAPRSAVSGTREPDIQPELELEKATIGNCSSSAVYAGAGKKYDVIGHLSAGTEIELYQWHAGGTWCRVFYGGGRNNGWVPAEVVVPQ